MAEKNNKHRPKSGQTYGRKPIRKVTDAGMITLPAGDRINGGKYRVETHADGSFTLTPLEIPGSDDE